MTLTKRFKLAALGLIVGVLSGCASTERFVKVAEQSVQKTAMVQVTAVVEELQFTITQKGLDIKKSTATVRYLGAGVFISPNGHILTCAHLFNHGVVKAIDIETYTGYSYRAELLFSETSRDLALLYINDLTPNYARLADPRKLRVGQEVIAVGNPLGLDFSVTHGIISALNRDFKEGYNVTQSDAFINPGNSGGPLFNLKGELVGINSFIIPPVNAPIFTGAGFSVQSGQIIEFLTRYRGLDKAFPKFNYKYWRTYGRKG